MERDLAGLSLDDEEDDILELGHSNSFCQARMALGVEVAEMGWDLTLKAQSRQAMAMNSVWLKKGGEGVKNGNNYGRWNLGGPN
ncbi:hypothetical protein J1N35_024613 [Gossypium stocksii]|uniref:Uncharacterized protein n=1 Tax=Gossypium stocksii TaxID=47602 RepID=A0A9D3ZVH9_9ROSI|nr:hypothetical protein J1N35_024613 [Gossypium stocksii]